MTTENKLLRTFITPILNWDSVEGGSSSTRYSPKWKAKFVEDKDKSKNRVEIRKFLTNPTLSQRVSTHLLSSNLLLIVYKDQVIMSTNGRGTASFQDIEDMQNAILEARDYLERK